MTIADENTRRRSVSERYLAEVEARPRAVKPFVNRLCAELGINGNEWRLWLQREAPDHAARWQRAKLMWCEARDYVIEGHPKMGITKLAQLLGVHRTTVAAVRARLGAKRNRLPGQRVGAGLRTLPEDVQHIINTFECRLEAYESGEDTSNPNLALTRLTAAWRRVLRKAYVAKNIRSTNPEAIARREAAARQIYQKFNSSNKLMSYRPDLYARYLDAVDAFWQRAVMDAMVEGNMAAAQLHEVSKTAPIRRRLRLLEAGKEVNRMVMRDGAIEVLPPRYKKPKETIHDHQHADWEGY